MSGLTATAARHALYNHPATRWHTAEVAVLSDADVLALAATHGVTESVPPPNSRYYSTGPVPRANLVRTVLANAGLGQHVRQVTSGRRNTWVRLPYNATNEDADQVAAALTPLWTDGKRRVLKLYSGAVVIDRDTLIANPNFVPAAS